MPATLSQATIKINNDDYYSFDHCGFTEVKVHSYGVGTFYEGHAYFTRSAGYGSTLTLHMFCNGSASTLISGV